MTGDVDADEGETRKNAAFFRDAFQSAVDRPQWLPADVDIGQCFEEAGVQIEINRLVSNMLEIWLDRCLATIGRLWKQVGYKALCAAMVANKDRDRRPGALVRQFTEVHYRKCIESSYEDHLERTERVFFPGRYLDDSRTHALILWAVEKFAPKVAPPFDATEQRVLVSTLLVAVWVGMQFRPEAVHHFLRAHSNLITGFGKAGGELALTKKLRELWADAPANGGRHAVLKQSETAWSLDKRCHCSDSSGCVLGRAAKDRAPSNIAPKRAQMPSWHVAKKIKSGTERTNDEACQSAASLTRFLRDKPQMEALITAMVSGGERAVCDVVHSHKFKGCQQSDNVQLGIFMVSDVRANMMARLLFVVYWWVIMKRGGLKQIVLPSGTGLAAAPHLAKYPSQRVMAFVVDPPIGAGLTSSVREKVVAAVLLEATRICPEFVKWWSASKVADHPHLATMVQILLDEMHLADDWDTSRWEELPCEVAKGLVGRLIHIGQLPSSDAMKGFYDDVNAAADSEVRRVRFECAASPACMPMCD